MNYNFIGKLARFHNNCAYRNINEYILIVVGQTDTKLIFYTSHLFDDKKHYGQWDIKCVGRSSKREFWIEILD